MNIIKELDSYDRVFLKHLNEFGPIFNYKSDPPLPYEVMYGPQEVSDEIEALIDKSIAERKDYLAEYMGYDPKEVRKRSMKPLIECNLPESDTRKKIKVFRDDC